MGDRRTICFQILEICLTVVALFVFIGVILPSIAIAFVPVQLYRWTLILYVKLFRKDFVRIMSGKNPVLAIDDIHGRPLCTIVGYGAFEGAKAEHMIQIASNCVEEYDPATNQPLHPETHQYYEEWMGYMWWKWEKNWQLDEHIIIWEDGRNPDKPVEEKDFMDIIAILEAKPFPKGKSPWEVVIVENVKLNNVKNPETNKCAIIYRVFIRSSKLHILKFYEFIPKKCFLLFVVSSWISRWSHSSCTLYEVCHERKLRYDS